ncbi:DEAD/DEAH box helicase [Candidatus Uhrbacteria bacterium]|nr:DEAD/DEAH box helicase [Candidatus Uhrbacteria bacterium]
MDRILAVITSGRNLVLSAPTGTGKSTQVPQAIYASGLLGATGKLLVVEPRRIAALTLAKRVAHEMGETLGKTVGCIVRKERHVSPETRICFVTDGVLIRMIEKDRRLNGVACVIFDEAHERKLLSDLGLAVLRKEQATHSKLRLVVMSATHDAETFASYMDAETVSLGQNAYALEIRHVTKPIRQLDIDEATASEILALHRSKRTGDILAFLPGKGEIEDARKALERTRKKNDPAWEIRVLHADLERGEQDAVFTPAKGRKIILATNVAETSLTVPGVNMVVDSGYERRATFDPESGAMRLEIQLISRSSATQRAGRAARECPGLCVRLWPESWHGKLDARPAPEIRRTDVASCLMTLKSIGLGGPKDIQFMDGPTDEQIAAGEHLLRELGAVDDVGALSPIGWRMLRLPLAPRYARMVVEAERLRCLQEVAAIAALAAGDSIRRYSGPNVPSATKARNAEAWRSFEQSDASDSLSLLRAYVGAMNNDFEREWCGDHGLNRDALREAHDLRKKIVGVCVRRGSKWNRGLAPDISILRCLSVGLPDRIAKRTGKNRFQMMNGDLVSMNEPSVVDSELVLCGRLRLYAGRGKGGEVGQVSLLTGVDQHLLHQAVPHIFRQRLRVAAYSYETGMGKLTNELLIGDLPLSSHEQTASHEELWKIDLDLAARAENEGLKHLNVESGKKGKPVIRLDGKEIFVDAEPGSYWARILKDGAGMRIHLLWRHFNIPAGIQKRPDPLAALRSLSGPLEKILSS